MAIRGRRRANKPKQEEQAAPDAKQERQAEAKRKPASRRDAPRKSTKSRNAIVRYFQDTGDELRKVSWPTREQAIRLTLIVLGSTIATAIFFGILDRFFQFLAAFLV